MPDLLDRIRSAVAEGRLRQPFTARDATGAVAREDCSFERVQSFLHRHCRGNLAATSWVVERVAFGKYRLLAEGSGMIGAARAANRSGGVREESRPGQAGSRRRFPVPDQRRRDMGG